MKIKILLIIVFLVLIIASKSKAVEYLWNITTLYDDLTFTVNRPTVYNGSVAYAGNFGAIYYWDGTQTSTIFSYGGIAPSSFNGNITWYAWDNDGGESDIYFWNGMETIQLMNDNNIDGFPSIGTNIIAWETHTSSSQFISYYNGSAVYQLTGNNGEQVHDVMPSVYDGSIAWARGHENGRNIMLWNGTDFIQVTSPSESDLYPSLYNGTIAFNRGSGQDSHIMFWDGTTVSEITQYTSYKNVAPRIALWENMIVWPGYDGQYTQIFLWDGSQVHQVTNNDKWHYDPDIYVQGNQIQIVYVETDNINENVLTQVIYAYATIPEPSQIILAMICIFLLFIRSNKVIKKQSLINRR